MTKVSFNVQSWKLRVLQQPVLCLYAGHGSALCLSLPVCKAGVGVLPGLDTAARMEGGNDSRASSAACDAKICSVNGDRNEIAPYLGGNLFCALEVQWSPQFWLLLKANWKVKSWTVNLLWSLILYAEVLNVKYLVFSLVTYMSYWPHPLVECPDSF